MVNCTLITASLEADTGTQALKVLQQVPYIQYPVQFQDEHKFRALINSGSEVNAMTPAYAANLGLFIRSIDIVAQIIDGLALITYVMITIGFSV